MLVADVWPCGYSEVWVLDSPFSPHFVSNVDFSIFGQTFTVETAQAVYYFIVVGTVFTADNVLAEQKSGNLDARGVPKYWPQQLPPPTGSGQYAEVTAYNWSLNAGDLEAVNAIHHYYQINRVALEADARQRAIDEQRIAAEEAARKAAMPPLVGPPAYFKKTIYYPTPAPATHQ